MRGTPKKFISPEALNMPLQLGPITKAPVFAASFNISASIFFPSSPDSPRPAVMIMIPLAPIFTLSATDCTRNLGATTIMTTSTSLSISVIFG